MPGKRWISPREASELLGVHPTTLRVWTNQGKLAAYRTAGGHRRFDEADIRRFIEQSRQTQADLQINTAVERTLTRTREELSRQLTPREAWYGRLDAGARDAHRVLGRQILGLLVQYVARETDRERIMTEGRQMARDMTRLSMQRGLSATEVPAAFLIFRDSLIDSLVPALTMPGRLDADDIQIYRRAREFFNQLLGAVVETTAGMSNQTQ
jgi:excisionase family DNA binding protein